jgi:hypothetical protein
MHDIGCKENTKNKKIQVLPPKKEGKNREKREKTHFFATD